MSKKKKILVFIDWFLPGYKAGGPIRSVANIVDHLSEDFTFKIITKDTDYLEKEPYSNIESDIWISLNKNTSVYYFSKKNLSKNKLKELIFNTEFDFAYINGIYSFYFSILPLFLLKKRKKKIIVAARGMLSDHAFSSKNFKKLFFLKIAKTLGLYNNVFFQATNKKEAIEIKNTIQKAKKIITAPNLPKKISYFERKKRKKKIGFLTLVSIARISTEKNTLFALEMLSKSLYKGKIQFDIYGSVYNQQYWTECKKIIKNLPDNITISYKGNIESQKVYDTFSKYHFSYMPSKGENFGHSILESLSAGCPVITSDQTPWQDLENQNIGWDIALSDTCKFIDTIQKCIDMKQKEYDKISENAFNYAKKYSNNPNLIEKTKRMFNDE